MKLYVSGSPRNKNSFTIIKNLMNINDAYFPLNEMNIQYCKGCIQCQGLSNGKCRYNDDMTNIYDNIDMFHKIILVSPVYFNNVTAQMKTFIDRLYPFYGTDKLKNKKIYLVLTGGATEEENSELIENQTQYFKEVFSWFDAKFERTIYFKDGEILSENFIEKIMDIKAKIGV
ncbi:MAG: hypothetical protein E7311_04550 [Clostridiales bacterium]|nr:hypothetical protein [Clostridiales bacterium]